MKAKEVLKEVLNTLNTLQYREKVIKEYAKAKCKEQRGICFGQYVKYENSPNILLIRQKILNAPTPDFE